MSVSIRALAGAAVAVSALAVVLSQALPATATGVNGDGINVYQAKVVNRDTVLGPQSDSTLLVQTGALPAGIFHVQANVGLVVDPNDSVVCAAYIAPHNDGVFGEAGNAGADSIYQSASMVDTVRISKNQHISLGCNVTNYGQGTYASSAVLDVIPVAGYNNY